jgi:hypothetical protein
MKEVRIFQRAKKKSSLSSLGYFRPKGEEK